MVILLMRVLIAGGGTGGHLYPGIAVAETLRRRRTDAEVRFVGTRRGIEQRVLPGLGFTLYTIRACGWPPGPLSARLRAAATHLVGFFQSVGLCLAYRPEVVVGTGAYVSAPVVLAAKLLGRPCLVLEQNRVPGRTNRLLGRVADEVHLSYAESGRYFVRRDNLRLTGNPIRPGLIRHDRPALARKHGLLPEKTTLFVFGGSRGAHRINLALVEALPLLEKIRRLQVVVQTGDEDHELVRSAVAGSRLRVVVLPYLDDIAEAYCLADLVLCRAGATTLAEVTACGVPAILVPYPHATDDHQYWNAEKLVTHGAAERILDHDLTGRRLARSVRRLVMNPAHLRRMAIRSRLLARPDAAERVARSIEHFVGGEEEAA